MRVPYRNAAFEVRESEEGVVSLGRDYSSESKERETYSY